ncbi:MAG TPA: NF038130 family PEP-CTERM protein [Oscillatoriaceae cyanobacterium M33_DOE_052]|uniref:PEP-CTERM sorting domain-containing protein n=1 Tax=Planktothricoides sp. SpSt-374 TaxID=2282167 RepID=A0A7C3ZI07_9CYAN|nr:NF038130 family PEP-CTERM protein [Oscillatoriaceae cyanobacterium M33_DOE_052]
MTTLTQKLLIGSIAAAATLAAAPAFAGSFTVSGTDYYLYDVRDSNGDGVLDQTYRNSSASLDAILAGNKSNPGGNIELFASSERAGTNFFAPQVTLSGQVGSQTLTLSSLNANDWFSTGSGNNYTYSGNTLATRWFNSLLTAAGQGGIVNKALGQLAFNQFLNGGGFQRSSDPNISYIDHSAGKINIGLAGHYNMKDVYNYAFIPNGFQASEVVKYTYGGVTQYLYNFNATATGLKELSDGKSHSGNYEVTVAVIPEPSTMVGLMSLGGILAATKKRKAVKES